MLKVVEIIEFLIKNNQNTEYFNFKNILKVKIIQNVMF